MLIKKERLKVRRFLTLLTLVLTGVFVSAAPALASVVNIH